MKILFIGGTGIISSACSELAIKKGFELYHFNRGKSHRKIKGAINIIGDIRNKNEAKKALKNHTFDVVVNWINFIPQHILNDIEIFRSKTKQYVFISSASVYQKPVLDLPITEETPLINPFWKYSQDKIECEKLLMKEYKKNGFPVTIVRPSHTYDKTLLPMHWGYTVINRMKKGKKTIIHGDGTSLWVLTHHKDFAIGFIGLLGNKKAIGEDFHITNDFLLTWNYIYELIAKELNVKPNFVHIPSTFINKFDKEMGAGLLGDKSHSVIFDNSKIKKIVPSFNPVIRFEQGVKEIIKWYNDNPEYQIINKSIDKTIDNIIKKYGK